MHRSQNGRTGYGDRKEICSSTECNCTKPGVLLQSALVLREDLQSPEVELGAFVRYPRGLLSRTIGA
ncbi:hypothetical protein SLEP1_g10261 [Rubroshorea leprosula]|uniref:Uncharacterized protein n=1 Tax=Rubroshorea leprosula TaxID=152421 RepID=A0AAV5IHD2_9ROSI|nr:hypothetical protein SLEP1_g10261 [Rubroshorea leprosula]